MSTWHIYFTEQEAARRAASSGRDYVVVKTQVVDANNQPLFMVWDCKSDHYVEYER
jgi:hypothetical protein